MKILVFTSLILAAFWGMGICPSLAQGAITFGPRETKIIGSIPYTLIGKYEARFGYFKGRIILDDNYQTVRSVYLEIEASSIKSGHPWLDKLARSRRLLNTARFPRIIFKSDKIIHDENGYEVKGILEMHGLKRRMAFPFKVESKVDQRTNRKLIDIKGRWIINRKDFNIIWNKYLDHGGIVVGDYFTVDWGIKVLLGISTYPSM